VNALVAGLLSMFVGAGLATVAAVGLVTSQTAAPAPDSTSTEEVITYDN
jgi:hypothetical protein